jgi:hypothetical protein
MSRKEARRPGLVQLAVAGKITTAEGAGGPARWIGRCSPLASVRKGLTPGAKPAWRDLFRLPHLCCSPCHQAAELNSTPRVAWVPTPGFSVP